ncbi:MAG: hypothetical protein CMH79_05890 [Nitrospinae bacterium]|nr:hypothetical protein [Nitrospinota bacterium]
MLCAPCVLPHLLALGTAGATTRLVNKSRIRQKKIKKELQKTKRRKKTKGRKKTKTKKFIRGGRRRIGTKKDAIRLQKKVQNKYKKCIKSCKTNYCRSKCLKEFHKDWSNKDKYLRGQGRKRKYTSRV